MYLRNTHGLWLTYSYFYTVFNFSVAIVCCLNERELIMKRVIDYGKSNKFIFDYNSV